MALSEYERRALADIEQSLLADSPQFGARFAVSKPRRRRPRIPTLVCFSYALLALVFMSIGFIGRDQAAWLVVLAGYILLVVSLSAAFYGWVAHRHDW